MKNVQSVRTVLVTCNTRYCYSGMDEMKSPAADEEAVVQTTMVINDPAKISAVWLFAINS